MAEKKAVMTYRAYVKTVRDMARAGWGRAFDDANAAVADLTKGGVDVTAAGVLELVRRLNVVIDALARDTEGFAAQEIDYVALNDEPPEYAIVVPGVKSGDVLYGGDLEDGFSPRVVVAVAPGGHCLVVPLDADEYGPWRPSWASSSDHPTLAAAVAAGARHELEYTAPRLDWARRALAAALAGEDLTQFVDGFKEPDEPLPDDAPA